MKYFLMFGSICGFFALGLLAYNTVDQMRFAKHEPGWALKKTWLYDRLMLLAALGAMASLGVAFAEQVTR